MDPKSRHKGKYETESYLAEAGLPYTAIRPTYIYGPQVRASGVGVGGSVDTWSNGRSTAILMCMYSCVYVDATD